MDASTVRDKVIDSFNAMAATLTTIFADLGGSAEMEWNDMWGTLYRQAFQLKTLTNGNEACRDVFYHKLNAFVIQHVQSRRDVVGAVIEPETLLSKYLKLWADYALAAKYLHDILIMHYLKLPEEETVRDFFMFCIQSWQEHLFDPLKHQIMDAVLCVCHMQRKKDLALMDPMTIPSFIRAFIVMGGEKTPLESFGSYFTKPYIDDLKQHYTIKSAQIIQDEGLSCYLLKAENFIEDELNRVSQWHRPLQSGTFSDIYQALVHDCWTICDTLLQLEKLYPTAVDDILDQVRKTVNEVLVLTHKETMANAFASMFSNSQWEDLGRMYRLFQRVDGVDTLEHALVAHLKHHGSIVVQNFESSEKKSASDYVDSMYDCVLLFQAGVQHAFNNSKPFLVALDKGFRIIMNLRDWSTKYLCMYMDSQLRALRRSGKSDDQSDLCLAKFTALAPYLQEKDMMSAALANDLAKRLIDQGSNSLDSEQSFISKLKAMFGVTFTTKMERMFSDITLSEDLQQQFNAWHKPVVSDGTDSIKVVQLHPIVLANGCWPSRVIFNGCPHREGTECLLPATVETAWQTYKQVYTGVYRGRKISFLSHLGSADMNAKVFRKEYTISVSTHVMCILCLFNHSSKLTFKDIQSVTNIHETHLNFWLQKLSSGSPDPKCGANGPLLLKTPSTNQISPNDVFEVNPHFLSKSKRFQIKKNLFALPGLNTSQERATQETEAQVKKERELLIDACIIRIMKARRTLPHNVLVENVIAQLSHLFRPQPTSIKTRITQLIEREFIARAEDDMNMYHYLA